MNPNDSSCSKPSGSLVKLSWAVPKFPHILVCEEKGQKSQITWLLRFFENALDKSYLNFPETGE